MIPDSRQTLCSLSSCIADDIIRGMKFPIIRDFPGDQRKTGVSKSKLDAPPCPTVEQLDFRLVARGEVQPNKTLRSTSSTIWDVEMQPSVGWLSRQIGGQRLFVVACVSVWMVSVQ